MSSRTFTAGWLIAAVLLSSWAVSSASDQPRPALAGAGEPPAAAAPDLSAELDAEIARLSSRVMVVATPAAPGRDPFKWSAPRRVGGGSRATAVSKLSGLSASVGRATAVSEFSSLSVNSEGERSSREAVALPDAAKQLTLSGVAELSAGALTAVLSFDGQLHYARTGDVIGGRYRIDAIAFDGADVFDLALGTISRLKFQA